MRGLSGMVENLDVIKKKLVEFLGFTNVTTEEIDNLFKVAISKDCESMRITWRKFPHAVRFDVGILFDEHFHRKSKVLTVKAKTENTTIHNGLEHTESKFQAFSVELKQ
jgi:hypothetical protein